MRGAARTASVFVLAALAAGPARADTVVLRDGRVISGRVIEQGDKVLIERPLGGTIVARADVLRIEVDAPGGEAERPLYDTVVLRDGRVVRGDVRFSQDGAEVIVSLGERGEVRHPRGAVGLVKWRDGRAEAADDPRGGRLAQTIERLVHELERGDAPAKSAARRELVALGAFARNDLERLAEVHPDALRPLLAELDRLEQLRRVLPGRAEEKLPRVAERLVSLDPAEREAALRAVVLEVPDLVGPLLLHVVKSDDAPRVRAYCVSQLSTLRRFEELAAVLKLQHDGSLRLAAAFALGDAGIYAGVPILIEALRLPDAEIRAVAIAKLQEYTSQHFGYRAQAPAEERERSIARWTAWWNEHGADLVRRSIRAVAPELEGAATSQEEVRQAAALWRQANELIASTAQLAEDAGPEAIAQRRLRLERAQDLLRQALDLDPSLVTARLTRAALLYEELDRPGEAERQLALLLGRAGHDGLDAETARRHASYHLGRIALAQGAWERALLRFTQAVQYDAGYDLAIEGQGDTHLGLALAEDTPDDKRRAALAATREAYGRAIAAVERREADLRAITREFVTGTPDTAQEGQILQSVRRSMQELSLRRAALCFKLGRVCGALQDEEGALAAYREAVRLDPERAPYQEALRAWGGKAPPREPAPEPGPGR